MDTGSHSPDLALLDRYLAGECSPGDALVVRQWLARDDRIEETLRDIAQIRDVASQSGTWDLSDGWHAASAALGIPTRADSSSIPERLSPRASASAKRLPWNQRLTRSPFAWIAAAVCLLVAITIPAIRHDNPAGEPESHSYATRRAQRVETALPDGSRVILGPDSHLRYLGEDGRGARKVSLTGQAYFTVTHDVDRPFLVEAGGITTQVLGTTFAVRAYSNDQMAQIAVAEGRVAVTTGPATVVLLAGDVGHASAGRTPIVAKDVSMADVFGWTRGQVSFRAVSLREAIPDLQRAYDIDIVIADSNLLARRITATLVDESIDDMLATVFPAIDATYDRHGRSVTVRSTTTYGR